MQSPRPLNIQYHQFSPNHTDEFIPRDFYLMLESIRNFFEYSFDGDARSLEKAVAYIFESVALNHAYAIWMGAMQKYALWCMYNRQKSKGFDLRYFVVMPPCDIHNIDEFQKWAEFYNPSLTL